MKTAEIKRKDDKPMIIHTKEKTKIHVKGKPEAKIKARNILTVSKAPKIAGSNIPDISDKKKPSRNNPGRSIPKAGASSKSEKKTEKTARQTKGKSTDKEQIRQEINKENHSYQSHVRTKADREKAIKKKSDTVKSIGAIGTKTALDQIEGGNELHDSYMVIDTISRPVTSTLQAGKNLFREQELQKKQEKIKKVNRLVSLHKKCI